MNDTSAGVDPKLLEILVCPVTKEPLVYDAAAQELISEKAKLYRHLHILVANIQSGSVREGDFKTILNICPLERGTELLRCCAPPTTVSDPL